MPNYKCRGAMGIIGYAVRGGILFVRRLLAQLEIADYA